MTEIHVIRVKEAIEKRQKRDVKKEHPERSPNCASAQRRNAAEYQHCPRDHYAAMR